MMYFRNAFEDLVLHRFFVWEALFKKTMTLYLKFDFRAYLF